MGNGINQNAGDGLWPLHDLGNDTGNGSDEPGTTGVTVLDGTTNAQPLDQHTDDGFVALYCCEPVPEAGVPITLGDGLDTVEPRSQEQILDRICGNLGI